MPFEYNAENHDWDLTLHASRNLIMLGRAVGNKKGVQFSCYSGSMLLSFCAIESFLNSIAFLMSRSDDHNEFDYDEYCKNNRFWNRLENICGALDLKIDKGRGLFQVIEEMRKWRNSLVHSNPYSIDHKVIIETKDTKELHKKLKNRQYTISIGEEKSKLFYKSAVELVNLLEESSKLKPRAQCSYKVL